MTNRDGNYDPRYRERRNPYFEQVLKEGANTSPIGAHSQGLSRLAFALLAGLEARDQDARAQAYRLQRPQTPISQPTDAVSDATPPSQPNPPSSVMRSRYW